MLKHLRAGNSAVLIDMSDYNAGDVKRLAGAHKDIGTLPDLSNASW